jgi:hypothetical protein
VEDFLASFFYRMATGASFAECGRQFAMSTCTFKLRAAAQPTWESSWDSLSLVVVVSLQAQ